MKIIEVDVQHSRSLPVSCVTSPFEEATVEAALKFSRYPLGFAPKRLSKARRNASASEKPTEAAMVSRVLLRVERRRFASLRRRFSTNWVGVLPKTLLN